MTNETNLTQSDLQASMSILDERLRHVERDLELECQEMRQLVGTNHPEFGRHIARLADSLNELHRSLNDVREKLSLDREETAAKTAVGQPDVKPEPRNDAPENDPEDSMDARTQSHIRHDEEITLSGIFRALLMADEPGQRHERKKLNE